MPTRFRPSLLVLASLFAACAVTPVRAEKPSGKTVAFSAKAYLDHIRFLADDDLGGRATGTEGFRRAGDYVADQFKQLGLEPAGDDATYFQNFSVSGGKELIDEDASIEISGLEQSWKVREDWTPLPFTKIGDVEGPLAFAGYGISAEDYHYDDYADFDATGKILLILRYEPKSDDAEAPFGGKSSSSHAMFSRKARVAARHGAKALIIVNPPNRNPDKDELYPWSAGGSRVNYALPMIQISRAGAGELLTRAQMPDLTTLQEELDRNRESLSTDLAGVTAKIETGVRRRQLPARNVIGLLKGSGDTDELIVVGAHYDHLGTKTVGKGDDAKKQVYNGADDNASGTAAVIELARAFSHAPPPRRGILFMTFAGEELGLRGSRHFAAEPTVDLDRVKAMVNFDMIGHYRPDKFEVWGTGTGSEFSEMVARAAKRVGLEYAAPRTTGGIFMRSDHASFYSHDIPVLFPFTGLHKQYHKPSDDVELINADGAATILDMFYEVIRETANLETGPTFVSKSEQPDTAAGDESEPAHADADSMPRVRLGIMPGQSDAAGLLVETVSPDGAASAAGMHDGDLIVRIADHVVRDMASYFEAVKSYKPGDTVKMIVSRDGKKVTLEVTFKGS